MTSTPKRPLVSCMLAVPDAPAAVEWYMRALGAVLLWDLGSVVGMEIDGAPFFVGQPEKNDWSTPQVIGTTTFRIELFCDDPDAVIARALEAGAAGRPSGIRNHRMPWGLHRQGGFTDPFGHIWFVGDRSPLARFPEAARVASESAGAEVTREARRPQSGASEHPQPVTSGRAQPGAARRLDVFFYGLFMDVEVLRGQDVVPAAARPAFIADFALRIGRRATLVPSAGARAYGMIMSLTREELDRLYAVSGLEEYRPEAVFARPLDAAAPVSTLCYNLREAPSATERNPGYAEHLKKVLMKLGFPDEYIASIG